MPDHVMNYVESDLAPQLTLAAWRQSRQSRTRSARRRRFRLRLGSTPAFA